MAWMFGSMRIESTRSAGLRGERRFSANEFSDAIGFSDAYLNVESEGWRLNCTGFKGAGRAANG
jgi:hypothetical protein